ncbi:MAG: PIN domain-containing protein [Candidatus Bipolaricaulota bacterium]|nr:PIN domain-containing protein [Candidatus Bipolaricaulota bacterium]
MGPARGDAMLIPGVFVAVLLVLGGAVSYSYRIFPPVGGWSASTSSAFFGALGGAVFAGLACVAWRRLIRPALQEGRGVKVVNALVVGLAGALFGAVFCAALGFLLPPSVGVRIAQGTLLAGGALAGMGVGLSLPCALLRLAGAESAEAPRSPKRLEGRAKVIDTSVIIDGRIGDLASTGFLEGEILIPEFVLAELQNVADSSDALRRRKGRRGLEILRGLMENDAVNIRVVRRDYPTIAEVDRKLIRLAHEENAVLVTTDYNLNRVAQVEGIGILNVNELANAVRPRFVPGEPIDVEVIDRGAEINQGVGYLDDGTMIVVENGRRHIGRTIKATVKSTLQTEAGRMLFVEPANEAVRWDR